MLSVMDLYILFILLNGDLTYQSLADKVKPLIPKQIEECCEDFAELHNDIDIDNEIEMEAEIKYNGGWFESEVILLNISKEILNVL